MNNKDLFFVMLLATTPGICVGALSDIEGNGGMVMAGPSSVDEGMDPAETNCSGCTGDCESSPTPERLEVEILSGASPDLTQENFETVFANPANPELKPVVLWYLYDFPEKAADTLKQILEQNPNVHLQAIAARRLGKAQLMRTIIFSDESSFAEKVESLKIAMQYFKQARDLYSSLGRTHETIAMIPEICGPIEYFK